MLLAIKTKKYKKDFYKKFQKKYKLLRCKDRFIVIIDENNKELFMEDLAKYISDLAYIKFLQEALKKQDIDNHKIKYIIEKEKSAKKDINHFPMLTYIYLNEYFKNNRILNIEAYIDFNMKSFKREVYRISEDIINNLEESYLFQEIDFDNNEEEDMDEKELSFEVKITKDENNNFVLKDNNDTCIDEKYIKNKLLINIVIENKDSYDNDVITLTILVFLVQYFQNTTIYFDNKLSDEDENIIKKTLELSAPFESYEIKKIQ